MSSLGNEKRSFETETWLTPPHILEALGQFDLDPCASLNRPWDTAKQHYTIEDDGLAQDWFGRVWCNPPYGKAGMVAFLKRMHEHGNGIALIFARTETDAFFKEVWAKADAVFFLKGRLKFHRADGTKAGSSGSPSVLIPYGQNNIEAIKNSGLVGKLIQL